MLISEVSRLGRRPSETYVLLEQLTELGISIYVHNYGMETLLTNEKRNPAVSLIFVIFNEQVRTEVELLSERIRSGQAEAKRKGKHIGRRPGSKKWLEQLKLDYPKVIKYLRDGTYTIREIAKLTAVANGTVLRVKNCIKI